MAKLKISFQMLLPFIHVLSVLSSSQSCRLVVTGGFLGAEIVGR